APLVQAIRTGAATIPTPVVLARLADHPARIRRAGVVARAKGPTRPPMVEHDRHEVDQCTYSQPHAKPSVRTEPGREMNRAGKRFSGRPPAASPPRLRP